MRPEPDFPTLVAQFKFQGEFVRAETYGFGHINDTYVAYFRKTDGKMDRTILQRINPDVFARPDELMANVSAVTAHLRQKIHAVGGDPDRETLTLIPTKKGYHSHRTEGGYCWRAFLFIENARSYQIPPSPQHVYNVARAYGNFVQWLEDFPVAELYETIPDFHNTPQRLQNLVNAIETDSHNRVQNVKEEIDFVFQRVDEMPRLVNLIDEGKLPVRVTHNDTKFNNVLIDDQTGKGICVIDLDTVMPGTVLYDFGDAIRSLANTAEEDQRDLSRVCFSLERFEKYAQGYLESTGDMITPIEIELLPFSARLMTLECGMRFLTDYISGDIYFRTTRANQNLDRCRVHFKLVQEMEDNHQEMGHFIHGIT